MNLRTKYKILYCYPYFYSPAYPDMKKWVGEYVQLLNDKGFNIEPFCITIAPPNDALSFASLNYKWKHADNNLMQMYEALEKKLSEGFDVLVNAVGINLHPEFVQKLPVFTVFCCADDPENSNNLSKPAAYAYNLSLVCNIAEVDTYKKWGVKYSEWLPMGLWPHYYNPNLTEEELLKSLYTRKIDLFMIGDKLSPPRKERMEQLDVAFPNAHFYGRGWNKGLLPLGEEVNSMLRSKLGPNVHNSTGPINLRLYTLPANGVLQICDNKKYLANIYELGKEVVGYDTIDECIDLCRYYLAHENERIEIALNGWRRVMRDYTEDKIFDRIIAAVDKVKSAISYAKEINKCSSLGKITINHKKKTWYTTLPYKVLFKCKQMAKNIFKKSE